MTIPIRVPLAVLLALGASARADSPRTEVSKDGAITASLPPVSHEAPAHLVTRTAGVPYGATPNWQLNLRRQVGAVRIADMNGDGRLDLVVGCYISNSFPPYDDWHDMVFLNTGTTLEATPSWISSDQTHTGDIQIGDINKDRKPDILAVSGSFNPPRIYFSQPGLHTLPSTTAGWFANPPQSSWATSGLLFDADNDNDLDVLMTNQAQSPDPYRPMTFYRNSGGVLETTPSWLSAEASIQNTAAAADIDGDGLLDVAVAKWVNFQSGIYKNVGGTLATTPMWTDGSTAGKRGVAFADVDHNGWPDLMIGGASTSQQSRLWMNNAGVLTPGWTASLAFVGQQENTFHDVNRDGWADYAEVHFSNGQTHIWLNNNGTLSATPDWMYDAPEVGNAIDFGDINGDGRPDLAIGYSGDVSVRVFFAVPPPCPTDINHDGVMNTADLLILLGSFGQSVPPGTNGDINGDGQVTTTDLTALLGVFGQSCP